MNEELFLVGVGNIELSLVGVDGVGGLDVCLDGGGRLHAVHLHGSRTLTRGDHRSNRL